MKYLGIDIGIVHLAIVGFEINDLERFKVVDPDEIYLCKLINITEQIYNCNRSTCKLYHEKTICDYMMHLFQNYSDIFKEADKILIERQPLQGLISVQDLILREYRSKCLLVSPNSMHKYFGINDLDYERRKVSVEKISSKYLSGFREYCFNTRKHDMADAFCILYFYLVGIKEKVQEKARYKEFKKTHTVFLKNLNDFKYVDSDD